MNVIFSNCCNANVRVEAQSYVVCCKCGKPCERRPQQFETIGVVVRDPGQKLSTEIKQALTEGRPVLLTAPVSNCCRAPMQVEGDVTHYHACTKCGHACDPAIPYEQT